MAALLVGGVHISTPSTTLGAMASKVKRSAVGTLSRERLMTGPVG